ncbi:alpha/beta hydrolase [Nocardia sp. NPDC058705]|uniref:alpha/beta hydrolase n=1 Tax=Nocardia sp. NPDC058705 TaxID=3346609 RepID=UPI0036928C2C
MKLSALRTMGALRTTAVALTAALTVAVVAGGAATAAPDKASGVSSIVKDGRTWHLQVYSAAMKRDIPIDVQRPAEESKSAPTFYMLNGLDGGAGTATWTAKTQALEFLTDKHVNVIQVLDGRGSYFTDWKQEDPNLGLNKWRTFLTEELPPLLEATLASNGLNALAGLSTSGTSVLQLAEAKPGLFKSVAAYSGCAQIADPMGRQAVKFAVEPWAGGNTLNMYGPEDDPAWVENDPVIHAEKLRGTHLYVSSGSGMPTNADIAYYLKPEAGVFGAVELGLGIGIEAATNACSQNLKAKLDSLNIPATFQFTPMGTHYWPYWEQALLDSWPVLAKGLGI